MARIVLPETALLGMDFSSAPSRREPITVAHGRREGAAVRLVALEAVLARPGRG